jgi:hypothetical protein
LVVIVSTGASGTGVAAVFAVWFTLEHPANRTTIKAIASNETSFFMAFLCENIKHPRQIMEN